MAKQIVQEPCGLDAVELSALSDDIVMAHLQAGHASALAVLFDRYHRLVLSVALKIVRDIGEAEDVMQNVFLEIFRSAAQFDPARGTTKVWILQYAYHRSISRRQQLAARKFYDSTEISEATDRLVMLEDTLVVGQETRQLVAKALAKLNSTQRQVLELVYFEGLSMKEIAEQTGQTLANIRHHYYRGLAKIRSVLNDTEELSAQMMRKGAANASA